ncbi:MAG TPA: PAS domain-containing protein [Allosphingosinicella sp.]|jgi:PAS domain-containing protein
MTPDTSGPETLVAEAVSALGRSGSAAHAALEALGAPLYVTDADGRVVFCTSAVARVAGRTPRIGEDRYCVSHRLYTADGEPLPHEECPMAVAVRERRAVRGVEAIAERPDGTRIPVLPFPTPIFDEDGVFRGAVNLFVDLTDSKRADYLNAQAKRCRRLAQTIGDKDTVDTLARMAEEYDAQASALERPH